MTEGGGPRALRPPRRGSWASVRRSVAPRRMKGLIARRRERPVGASSSACYQPFRQVRKASSSFGLPRVADRYTAPITSAVPCAGESLTNAVAELLGLLGILEENRCHAISLTDVDPDGSDAAELGARDALRGCGDHGRGVSRLLRQAASSSGVSAAAVFPVPDVDSVVVGVELSVVVATLSSPSPPPHPPMANTKATLTTPTSGFTRTFPPLLSRTTRRMLPTATFPAPGVLPTDVFNATDSQHTRARSHGPATLGQPGVRCSNSLAYKTR